MIESQHAIMDRQQTCRQCERPLADGDTVIGAVYDRLAHLDCKRPQVLRPEERALLFRYCSGHAVADCGRCARGYLLSELAADLFTGRDHLCARCHADLTDSVRWHLVNCTMLPAMVRERARQAREAARRLVKRSQELSDSADVLMRELEVVRALHELREAMKREPPQRGT